MLLFKNLHNDAVGFTAFKSFKLGKGLYLEERVGAAHYKARASVKGQPFFTNTETTDFDRAQRIAVSWFKRLGTDANSQTSAHTMKEAAKGFLADLSNPVTKLFHESKWNAISDFFNGLDVDAVTTPVLKDFIRWHKHRAGTKGKTVVPHTTRKDFVTIRRVLRHAVEEGWLDRLPLFPKLERIKANPRPWLEPHEWDMLVRVAEERIRTARDERTKQRREELLDFCWMMVTTCARVDEVRKIRVRDCLIKDDPRRRNSLIFEPVKDGGYGYTARQPGPYLEVSFHGKTNTRRCITREGAVEVFNRLVARRSLKPSDFLFSEHHRDAFRELLIEAGLREKFGYERNLKSLRCTGLMFWIKSNLRINLQILSDNVGTSVGVLSQYYLKPLTAEMHPEELLG